MSEGTTFEFAPSKPGRISLHEQQISVVCDGIIANVARCSSEHDEFLLADETTGVPELGSGNISVCFYPLDEVVSLYLHL